MCRSMQAILFKRHFIIFLFFSISIFVSFASPPSINQSILFEMSWQTTRHGIMFKKADLNKTIAPLNICVALDYSFLVLRIILFAEYRKRANRGKRSRSKIRCKMFDCHNLCALLINTAGIYLFMPTPYRLINFICRFAYGDCISFLILPRIERYLCWILFVSIKNSNVSLFSLPLWAKSDDFFIF